MMKKRYCLVALLLVSAMLLSSCASQMLLPDMGDSSIGGNKNPAENPDDALPNNGDKDDMKDDGKDDKDDKDDIDNNGEPDNNGGVEDGGNTPSTSLPDGFFLNTDRQSVIGSIVQTGDGNVYVSGTVPAPRSTVRALSAGTRAVESQSSNSHLVTMAHNFGTSCFVSGYMGNSLYIIQDFGSLGWNKKGIGHMDGTVLLDYNEGYFSISALSENKAIVGHPSDASIDSLWGDTSSYLFGYMVYNPDTKEVTPLYEENNLRFYTAGYFLNGRAIVSVMEGEQILFGIIDEQGNYVVEPTYRMMADETYCNMAIVATEAEPQSEDNCGRIITYNSTLQTNVQATRRYNCLSSTVGLINVLTGESILPCQYTYIERVLDGIYFLITNEGGRFLYDSTTHTMTEAGGTFTYFCAEWMLHIDNQGEVFLADRDLTLYSASDLDSIFVRDIAFNAANYLNGNLISGEREELVNTVRNGGEIMRNAISEFYDPDRGVYTVTVNETGDVIENVKSYTYLYNGGFLYTVENSLYRYDLSERTSTKIHTGYGDFTEDYNDNGREERYYASLQELDEGVYCLRYNTEISSYGSTYFMVIINDRGTVLFNTAINDVERLVKNYLGQYDNALYDLAGNTSIEDNYFLTRDDGSHFLIQFVRGEAEAAGPEENGASEDYTRVVDCYSTFYLLSPFALRFEDGSEIEVYIHGVCISPEQYVYDSETQQLKLLITVLDSLNGFYTNFVEDRYLEISVYSGNEMILLTIKMSPLVTEFY